MEALGNDARAAVEVDVGMQIVFNVDRNNYTNTASHSKYHTFLSHVARPTSHLTPYTSHLTPHSTQLRPRTQTSKGCHHRRCINTRPPLCQSALPPAPPLSPKSQAREADIHLPSTAFSLHPPPKAYIRLSPDAFAIPAPAGTSAPPTHTRRIPKQFPLDGPPPALSCSGPEPPPCCCLCCRTKHCASDASDGNAKH